MNRNKSRIILSLLLIVSMVLSTANVSTAFAAKKAVLVNSVSITEPSSNACTITKGATKQLKAVVTPSIADNTKLKWSSSNKSIVTVSSKGIIKGVKAGTATITVTASDGSKKKASITVTVGTPVTKLTATKSKITLVAGETSTIKTKVAPSKASNKKLTYTSSDEKVATVSLSGMITAVGEGIATITITAMDGSSKTTKVSVTVNGEKSNLILTETDVVNGKITLSYVTYKNVTIDNSVGNAEILLDHVTIKNSLKMESGAAYTVSAKDSQIKSVVALEEETKSVSAYSIDDEKTNTPTFIAGQGTLVVKVDARGAVSLKQDKDATIRTVTVNRTIDGNIELKLEGFSGNLVVNNTSEADIAITTKSCNIISTSIKGTSNGQEFTITDDTTAGNVSSIGNIYLGTNAKVSINVPASQLIITESAKDASVTIQKPVKEIVNEGTSTTLTLNSNVESVISKGDASQITGTGNIKAVEVQGNNTKINVPTMNIVVGDKATGTTINGTPISTGTSMQITPTPTIVPSFPIGGGGSGSSIPDPQPTTGAVVTPTPTVGAVVSPTPTTEPVVSPVPTTEPVVSLIPTAEPTPTVGPTAIPTIPATGTIITITDPGKIITGMDVQMKADLKDVVWSVYSYISSPQGSADIDAETGMLHPHQTGTVRVIARSKYNNQVYGAVDVIIQGKKFVRYEALNKVVLDSDAALINMYDLAHSGKLPATVSLIYETGVGTETETIQAQIDPSNWSGVYDGSLIGESLVSNDVEVPTGYEQPSFWGVEISTTIDVKVPQSDNRKVIAGFDSLDGITLSSDEHIMNIFDLDVKYLIGKEVTIHCDNESFTIPSIGHSFDSQISQFNGAVPGEYIIELCVPLPNGYKCEDFEINQFSIYYYYDTAIKVPIKVTVQVPQTSNQAQDIPLPNTTQPTLGLTQKAVINSVSLSGIPQDLKVGSNINLIDYLTVSTDSQLASDKRVEWSYDGTSYHPFIDSISGLLLLNKTGTHTITARSTVDSTKFDSVQINVVPDTLITEMTPFISIDVNADVGITSFELLCQKLQDFLPTTINAKCSTGDSITLQICGWDKSLDSQNSYTITPKVKSPYGFSSQLIVPELTINLLVPQTYTSREVISAEGTYDEIQLTKDYYASNELYLAYTLYGNYNQVSYVPIKARLEDNSEIELICSVYDCSVEYVDRPDVPYDGSKGAAIVTLSIILPEGYTSSTSNSEYDLDIEQEVNILVDQSPKYEPIWVTANPSKLSYKEGEKLDLSGIQVVIREFTVTGSNVVDTIGYDKFADYGIVMVLLDPNEMVITTDTPLTADMNGSYVFLYSDYYQSVTFFGPLTITPDQVSGDETVIVPTPTNYPVPTTTPQPAEPVVTAVPTITPTQAAVPTVAPTQPAVPTVTPIEQTVTPNT